jgi:effector-binding domain-containing protein
MEIGKYKTPEHDIEVTVHYLCTKLKVSDILTNTNCIISTCAKSRTADFLIFYRHSHVVVDVTPDISDCVRYVVIVINVKYVVIVIN